LETYRNRESYITTTWFGKDTSISEISRFMLFSLFKTWISSFEEINLKKCRKYEVQILLPSFSCMRVSNFWLIVIMFGSMHVSKK